MPNLWGLRDFCRISCPASPSEQSSWQHEVTPALALSASFWRSPGYSFYHLFGQHFPLLHCLCPEERSETSVNLPSCNFPFEPCCSLCCWDNFGSVIVFSPSWLFQDLSSRAAVCSQSVRRCGVSLAQVCNFLLLIGTLLLAQPCSLFRFLWAESLCHINPPLCKLGTVLDLL